MQIHRMLVFVIVMILSVPGFSQLYKTENGTVSFVSEAPLELIKAASDGLRGVINVETGHFAFSIPVRSFNGFNSPLQKEHFNENYLESAHHPIATFSGRILDPINLLKDGKYEVRTKGKLNIHGMELERIIKSDLIIENGKILISCGFTVFLKDHHITIPKIVYQKIAEEIRVKVEAVFFKTNE